MQEKKDIPIAVQPSEKREAVGETLKELQKEKKAAEAEKRNRGIRRIFYWILWPLAVPIKLILKLFAKIRLPLTVKMLLIFSTLFSLIMVGYAIFVVQSVAANIRGGTADQAYIAHLTATSAVIVALSVIIFSALSGVGASLVINPIRRITQGIDDITADDLSKRLDPVDTQDELMELTSRINGMLDNIEETFLRQDNFVADASHELKTPIAVITGYVNLLKRWGSKDESILNEGIDSIARESENMQRIVEQLLLLARIGEINVNVTRFDIDEVLRDMVDGYKLVKKTHYISYDGGEKILLDTDKNLLLELVRILTDNAVKYTPPEGSITISCRLQDNALKIEVSDTGIGISEEDLPLIYDRFFRCDRARGRETGGSGLGLTIAKSISDTLGGEIEVKSELGKGTAFIFTLY